jgi:hypothetical protein
MGPGVATEMAFAVKVLVAVVMTLTELLWLPPSTNSELPSSEIARLRAGPVAIGDPTIESFKVFTSTTWFDPDSAM